MMFERYESYRKSGIEWLGDIPSEWEIYKLKYVVKKIGDIDHYMPASVSIGKPYMMTRDMFEKASLINFSGCKQVSEEDFLRLSRKIKPVLGDLIFARYATIGTVCYVDIEKDFLVSYACVTIKPNHQKIVGKYLFYFFKSNLFLKEIKNYVNSNTQDNIGLDSLYRTRLIVLPYEEQLKIVNYLDIKTQTINKEVTLLEQKTAKYKELKQTLINETVLRGLDRAVKLKESEIEWIGEIPEGWEVKRLKDLGKTETSSVDKKIRDGEDIVKIVNYIDVYNNGNRELYNSDNYMLVSANSLQKRTKHLKKGDMLFTPTSETIEDIGISAIVLQDLENTLYSYHLLRLNFYIVIDNKFKKYLFNNQYVQSYFSKSAKSSTRKILGLTVFDNLRVAIPPKREQTKIANYIDEKTQKI